MSSQNAFTPTGNTVTFTASTSAPTAAQANARTLGSTQYLVTNGGAVTVFVGFGSTNAAAVANAVVVTNTSPAVPVLSGTTQVFTLTPGLFFTGITSSGTSPVYITPGEGI